MSLNKKNYLIYMLLDIYMQFIRDITRTWEHTKFESTSRGKAISGKTDQTKIFLSLLILYKIRCEIKTVLQRVELTATWQKILTHQGDITFSISVIFIRQLQDA